MNKKIFIIPALLIAIGGGAVLAQTDYFEAALSNPKITATDAKTMALKEMNGDIVGFEYDGDDFNPHYEIEIVKDNEKVEIKIDAYSGALTVTERESFLPITKQDSSTVVPTTPAPETTVEPAISEQAPAPKVESKPESTTTSQAVSESVATPKSTPAKMISEQQAKNIALAKASGTITDFELDEDDDRLVYEIEIHNGKMEYEFKIDAYTGAITEYQEDLED